MSLTLGQIAVVGLGYVGLPLAVKLAAHFPVIGYDVKAARIDELRRMVDRTGEVDAGELRSTSMRLTTQALEMAGSEIFIITVPTPVDADNRPNLDAVRAACRTIGAVIEKQAIVILESTVYPGVTEEICGPEIERVSGLRHGKDFYLGYSPERINPGDREHAIDRIVKVVAGQTAAVSRRLADIYGAVNGGQIFIAKDIRTAEAAKVIENAQRDINIAFVNEVTMVFNRLGISIYDVLEASGTKWNFLNFKPGLVGGHCIGVDPFYLADLALRIGHDPAVILAGRRINDQMGTYIADEIARILPVSRARVLVLGLTFKEDVPDLRNSKVIDVVRRLTDCGHTVHVHDPLADIEEARQEYGIDLLRDLNVVQDYQCVVGAVAHASYRELDGQRLSAMLVQGGVAADIKGMWRNLSLPAGVVRWQL
jgi:UDP-N-acetyl-D-glucosamine/UDP-N-acetyl-D-galactosamine dehydrogenase